MKVLIVNSVMNLGGAEVMLMEILRHKAPDVEMHFLLNERSCDQGIRGYFDDEIEARGCKIYRIGSQGALGPRRYIKEFRRIIEEVRPDVVHTNLNAKNGFIALAAHRAGVKTIISHCHADIKFHGSLKSRLINEAEVFVQKFLIAHYCKGFWGCSVEANKRLYWPWVRQKSIVINNAIDAEKYANVDTTAVAALGKSYNLPEDCLILGNVGRIVRHKGIAFVPEVMQALKRQGRDSAFVVAGRKDDQDYINEMLTKARQYGVDHRIIFLGERNDVPVVMSSFDVFVGPALREGFGMVAVEAQAAGVPCVLYNGFPQLVDMSLGIVSFHSNFDAEAWAEDIVAMANKKIYDKTLLASTIKERGFDSKHNAEVVCNLYKQYK